MDINRRVALITTVQDRMSGKLGRMGAAAKRFMGVLRNVGFAAVAAGTALVAATKKVAQWGAAIYDSASQTGISIERMQAFSYVSEQMGAGADTVAKSLRGLSTFMRMADSETSEQAETLEMLGLQYEELMGLQPDELFLRVTDALEENTEGMERMTAASILFGGRYAQQVLGIMEQSEGTIRDSVDGFDQLGLTVGEETITKLKKFDDAMTTIGYMLKEMLADSFEPLLPVVKDLLEQLIEMAADVMPSLVPALEAVVNLLDLFAVVLDAAMPLIKGTAELAGWLGEQLGIIAEVLGGFPEMQREAVSGFKDLTASMKDAVESGAMPVDQAAQQLRGHIDLLSDTFGVHSTAVRQARDAYREFLAQLAILQQDIGEVQQNLEASVIAGTTSIDVAQARYEQVLRENAEAIEGGEEALQQLYAEQEVIEDNLDYYMRQVAHGQVQYRDLVTETTEDLEDANTQIQAARDSQLSYNDALSQGTQYMGQYAGNLRDQYARGLIDASEAAEMLRTQIDEYNRAARSDYGMHQIQGVDQVLTQFIGSLEGATAAAEETDEATSGAADAFEALGDREKKLLESYEGELGPKLLQNIADRTANEREYFEMVRSEYDELMEQQEAMGDAEEERLQTLRDVSRAYFEQMGFDNAKAMETAYADYSERHLEKLAEVAERQIELQQYAAEVAAQYWQYMGYESREAMKTAMEGMTEEDLAAMEARGAEAFAAWNEMLIPMMNTLQSGVQAFADEWAKFMVQGKADWSGLVDHMTMELFKLVMSAAFKQILNMVTGGIGGSVMGFLGFHAGGQVGVDGGGPKTAFAGLTLPTTGPYGDRHMVFAERGEGFVSAAGMNALRQGQSPLAPPAQGGGTQVHVHQHSFFNAGSEVDIARAKRFSDRYLGG